MREVKKKDKRETCINCSKRTRYISRHKLCLKCANNKVLKAVAELRNKEGKAYETWKSAIIKGIQSREEELKAIGDQDNG